MGSSKKHKEKKDRKKHKRSRSRERERKRDHKSSRKEKRRTPEPERQKPEDNVINIASDDEFDIDKLLDSKISENPEMVEKRKEKKSKREAALEEFRKRQSLPQDEDSLEKFANEQLMDEMKAGPSQLYDRRSPSLNMTKTSRAPVEGEREPQLTLSIAETNKLRAKLGLKPLEVKQKPLNPELEEKIKANKVRQELGLKPEPLPLDRSPERTESQSLSISETNKLRIKLGLKPLDVGNDASGRGGDDDEKMISKPAEEVFVKTENISEKKRSEALRERLKVQKEKRLIEQKLKKTKGVADSDSEDESASSWVLKHQKLQEAKELAEQRAKVLEEMDAEFGIGALVEEEFDQKKAYTSKNLKGLTIGHDAVSFQEGHNVILTLKDKEVLDENEDVLENVNMVDSEKYAKNVENKKKKPEYKAYDEPEYDEFGILKKKNMLSKYDEEIEGEKKKNFKIGSAGGLQSMSREQELELIRMKLKQQNEVSLDMPEMKIANEYFTAADMVQFKKPKKRRKINRKVLKANDLVPDSDAGKDLGSRNMRRRDLLLDDDEDLTGIPLIGTSDSTVDLSEVALEEEEIEKELHGALSKAKKLKERKVAATAPEKVLKLLGDPSLLGGQLGAAGINIEMNSVAEFCRTLGDIPTYGMSGNRDDEQEDMMDLERELFEEKVKMEIDPQAQGWNEVDVEDNPMDVEVIESAPILEEEPDISMGIAGALNLATKKGYLDKETKKQSGASRASQIQAQSYTIEEKFYEDEKFGKRERAFGPSGGGQEFKEKSNYKPDVKLEYIDDNGRLLSAKEAFRYLSHKFHGKGPGKNKVDKRMKKVQQDNRLKQMSSTDTPLHTVKLLQAKQKETQSPYIVLSGGNKTLTQTMISKAKPV